MLRRLVLCLFAFVFVISGVGAGDLPVPAGGRTHSFKVTVLDDGTGQPIAGAEVSFQKLRDLVKTATDGTALLPVPLDTPHADQLINFFVTFRASGYGQRQVKWSASAGRVLETLPKDYTVKLARGIAIGGIVRDVLGQPVSGARVELYGSGARGTRLGGDDKSQQEFPSIYLYGSQAPVTGENGRWQLEDFPADLNEVAITVTRPGGAQASFMAGSAPDLSSQQGSRVDLAALKSGQVDLALKEGFTVTGRVVDEAGRPLAGVTLRARDAASRNQAYKFATDWEGRFELRNWNAAKVLVSTEHDGYRGTTVTVPTGADAAEMKIVLRPGQPLRLRVVDEKYNPIPGAEIMTDPNPSEQIVEWKAQTDAAGRVEWPAAPDAPVKYWVTAKEHGGRTIKLLADGNEHVVRFRPGTETSVNVRLRAVDADSGAPIPAFEVWRRLPRPESFKAWGEGDRTGNFFHELRRDEFTKGIAESYRLEVRAAGYGTWGTETLEFANGDQEITVKLVKGGPAVVPPPSRQVGTTQDGDSNPALLALALKVVRLLETGDVAAFTQAVCATTADWQAIVPGGVDPATAPHGRDNGRTLERYKKAVTASAEHMLALARQTGLNPGTMRYDVKSVTAPGGGQTIYRLGGRGVPVPRLKDIGIVLAGEPVGGSPGRDQHRGEYQVSVGHSQQLPAGLKCEEGVRWRALPAGVGDEAVRNELRLVSRVADGSLGEVRSLSGADAALGEFAGAVVALLRTRDVPAFVAAVGPSPLGLPAQNLGEFEKKLAGSVRDLLALPERAGIDFAGASITVKQVVAGAVQAAQFGSVDQLRARSLQVRLEVAGGQTAAGPSVSGRYVVSFDTALRKDGHWLLGNQQVRWEEMPEGLLADEAKRSLTLENYVAEHHALPPGQPAPEIEFVRLADNTGLTLSSYRGKVVILEFWATWCGPCQEPMAKLQELVRAHPEWKDRVEVVALSVDEKAAEAAGHLASREWTRTLNVWAGEGGFDSAPGRAFRLRGIPTSYVIGRDGTIVASGHPESLDFAAIAARLLK